LVPAGAAASHPALGDFAAWAELLYAPLVHWCATRIVIEPLPALDDADDADDAADDEEADDDA
jgi:hypothetical protein